MMKDKTDKASRRRWLPDELLILLELYLRHAPKLAKEHSSDARDACGLMNRVRESLGETDERTLASVRLGLGKFRSLDPNSTRKGLGNVGLPMQRIWDQYASDDKEMTSQLRDELAVKIKHIRENLELGKPLPAFDEKSEDYVAIDGRKRILLHYERDRDKEAVRKKKAQRLKASGALRCEACTFDFRAAYGELGEGFIECHHVAPLAYAPPEGVKTRPEDLALLCANCHRMIHRAKPWLSVEALKALLEQERLAKQA